MFKNFLKRFKWRRTDANKPEPKKAIRAAGPTPVDCPNDDRCQSYLYSKENSGCLWKKLIPDPIAGNYGFVCVRYRRKCKAEEPEALCLLRQIRYALETNNPSNRKLAEIDDLLGRKGF